MTERSVTVGVSVAALVVAAMVVAVPEQVVHGQIAVRNQGFVPFSDAPINYREDPDDPVARLQRRLNSGDTRLRWEPADGYLASLLEQLNISQTSQMLVFSKTSFQYKKISPATPRAIYFNDDVYVGKVRDGKALEIVSFDAHKGAIFYLLDEQKAEKPAFQRAELDCTVCHVAPTTRNVPGVLVRSVYAMASGAQAGRSPSFLSGHESPLSERFGGWYVTGTTGSQRHLGNVTVNNPDEPTTVDRESGANVTSLASRVDLSDYLTPHSDIVAQLVHAHQTQAHNVMTQVNFQTRIAVYEEANANRAAGKPEGPLSTAARDRINGLSEQLVRYLLFADEASLTGEVHGTSGFAEQFQARGPRDRQGRSLRDLDLKTRLFRYPLSYLVYTEAFDALPEPAKTYVYQRLFDVLTGDPGKDEFWWLDRSDRLAIFDILRETKQGLPESWKTHTTRRAVATSAAASHTTTRDRGTRPD